MVRRISLPQELPDFYFEQFGKFAALLPKVNSTTWRRWRFLWAILLLARVQACFGIDAEAAGYPGERHLRVQAERARTEPLGDLVEQEAYGFLVYLPSLRELSEHDAIEVTVADVVGKVATKMLHWGDADFYLTLKPRATGAGQVTIRIAEGASEYELCLYVRKIESAPGSSTRAGIAALPNGDWTSAQRIDLGQVVYASNDERPYLPRSSTAELALQDLVAGAQWFTFDLAEPGPKLVHFIVDVLDRDVPMDVSLFAQMSENARGRLAAVNDGMERYNTEQSTKFHGLQKFIARVIKPGRYWVRVMGNHPFYRLRTEVYDPPPYTDPRQAIRVGMDYLLRKGDSWQANLPRRGSVALRSSNRLGETAQCVACHPTHFTTRAELIAIENGWPLHERPGLQFLTERLYNNPRPLYGEPDADWARMISAPGNVLSRLAEILIEFEKNVLGEPRAGWLEPIGAFLEKYWSGVQSPITESNGNQPRVSGFEVALHSGLVFAELYRRTGQEKYLDLRRQIEQVVAEGEAIDMIDLCWKLVALCELNRRERADQIDQIVAQVIAQQKTNGTWSVAFAAPSAKNYDTGKDEKIKVPKEADGTPKQSEFQTYHALYALAKAGVQPDDPRVAKTIQWCLSRQWSHGGWQGNADFKNFDTVFRDTQYAVMALSEFFKGPSTGLANSEPGTVGLGWGAPAHELPEKLRGTDTGQVLAALDEYWSNPGPTERVQLRYLLAHEQPLVRCAAAAALGRIADPDAVAALVTSLGDGSKLVQRAAAWALRQIASRKGVGQSEILTALQANADRKRWGALRIFNQHFKYLTGNWSLAEGMLKQLQNDPVGMNRMQAAQALWQWWFWDGRDDHRSVIEDGFIARLAAAEDRLVRRNLIEGLHNLLDDNLRYLRNDWIPALKAVEDKERVQNGQSATALRQAQKISEALIHGIDRQRDGILRSFYAFHLRESAVKLPPALAHFQFPENFMLPGKVERGENTWLDGYKFAATFDPCSMGTGALGRIGNDTEPPSYPGEAGSVLAAGLRSVLEENPVEMFLPVLKTLRSTRNVPLDASFAALLLQMASTPAGQTAEAEELLREQLPPNFTPAPESIAALDQIIRRNGGELLRLATAVLLHPHGTHLMQETSIVSAIEKRFTAGQDSDEDEKILLKLVANATDLHRDPDLRAKLFDLSRGTSVILAQEALRTILTSEGLLAGSRKRLEAELTAADPTRIEQWLLAAKSVEWKKSNAELTTQLLLGIVMAGLNHREAAVRQAALGAVGAITLVQGNAAVLESLRGLSRSDDPALSQAAIAQLSSLNPSSSVGGEPGTRVLDFDFFVRQVQPIFERVAPDGDSCARCHANHSILGLISPEVGQPLSLEQLRANFLSALKVVNTAQPEESLLLIKPLSSFDGIGQPENYRKTHGGDVRWPAGKESDEYKAILLWIQGTKQLSQVRSGEADK